MAAGLMARPAIAYGSAMPANLLIVESPSKAKTLKKYLGSDFEILASYGHIRDLVPKNGAVDPDKNFAMKYQIIAKNSKHVDAIAAAVREAQHIYLATDPDREGEAISWHLLEILKNKKLLKDKTAQRVVFHEITKQAVWTPWPTRATSRKSWSTPSRRAARWIIWLALICRRCCGKKSAVACPPAACKARRCG